MTPRTEARAHVASLLAVLAAAVLVYGNTFDVPFTFDDDLHLVEGVGGRSVSAALRACPGLSTADSW